MRNKKKMIAIGGAALALIAAATVTITLVHRNSGQFEDDVFDLTEDDGFYMTDDVDDEYGGGETGKIEGVNLGDYKIPEDGDEYVSMLEQAMKDKESYKNVRSTPDYDYIDNEESAVPERHIVLNEYDSSLVVEEPESSATDDSDEDRSDIRPIKSNGYKEHEVICDAQSQEAAKSIADEISGTLLSWNNGTATIQIEESVDELLDRLEREGSNLELYRHYIFDSQE